MYRNNKLASSVRYALLFGASSTAFVGSAIAQQDGADVERIQVTGSRIQRTDIESANPITVFSAEDLAASGHVTVEAFIHSIPSMSGGMNGRATNNGSAGFASASLRGLGSSRTLILINGRRYASGDLNSIPMSFIERVEVLRDGASTIYGSDAIAGVVNFITRRDFEGAEVVAQYDVTGEGDGETSRVGFTIGNSSNRGNTVLSLEYSERKPIWQGDRDFSRNPLAEVAINDGFQVDENGDPVLDDDGDPVPQRVGTERIIAGSTGNAYGSWSSLQEGSPYATGGPYVVDQETGAVRPFSSAQGDAYNYAPASYMVTPQKVFSINAAANYDLTQDITAFLEGGFTNRQSDQLMAADATFWGATMVADHPDNPIGEDISVSRRLYETGGRNFQQDFSDYRMVMGLEGYLDNGWAWDVSYNYARYVDARLDVGRANPNRYGLMLNPEACLDDADCTAATGGVGYWNPLAEDTLTPEMIAYASIPNSPLIKGTTKQLMANLTGDTGSFGLQAGPIGWATGYERRWQEYQSIPDGGATVGEIYSVTAAPSEGAYVVDEVYGELAVPLLAGMPGVERLDLSAAIRYTDYDFLDSDTTTKFGIEYVPVQDLLIRATYADGFRAPGISDLFAPQAETNTSYTDPCLNWGSSSNDNIRANCAAEGLPQDFELPNNQSASISGGNPDLVPETSTSFTAGFVWSPSNIQNFSLAVDYFNIEIEDGLGSADSTTIVRDCYSSENFSSPSCDLIEGPGHSIIGRPSLPGSDYRANDGIVSGILLTTANIATFETSGIDFDANWATELAGGQLRLRFDGTYLNEYKYQSQSGTDVLDLAGKYAADPNFGGRRAAFFDIRANFHVGYAMDNWDASLITRYQSGVDDLRPGEWNLSDSVGSYFYHDLQGSYYVSEGLTVTAGIRNLFDKQPPYVTANQDMNTLNSSYDTAGRYLYGRVNYRF
ncbi:TonB-dependent receptor domain-containing protein [Aliidiomarina soli]|uniref:TonB-dependent receptor n=1 Tax=Aliidiomarina soli TaxID=1928574 RepID=A0A432WGX0_9GAMM|nr:TonB-dependent receptor [Aliidiomarina soli]RUO32995.1 TonB-dependent receptor [Aliidiomarina soli]